MNNILKPQYQNNLNPYKQTYKITEMNTARCRMLEMNRGDFQNMKKEFSSFFIKATNMVAWVT